MNAPDITILFIMTDLDSYIIIEKDTNDEQIAIAVCLECREKHYPNTGWFYEASEGYSDYLWKCHKCEKIIHDPEETDGGPIVKED